MNLSDRLRGIVSAGRSAAASGVPQGPTAAPVGLRADLLAIDDVPGGEWRRRDGARCFVVEQRVGGDVAYGDVRVGEIAERIERASAQAPLLTPGAPACPPFIFFDLETTGLSGGAGTYAFLVGCGWFDGAGAFVTRQYLLATHSGERPMLEMVGVELARAGTLVSFNGKSFDAPVLETRHLFHRLEWTGGRLPHLDVLYPARRFWGEHTGRQAEPSGPPGVSTGGANVPTCSLGSLEQQVLGARRSGDVSGFEIPGRYFQFVRSGDARPLMTVLEHNRRDLLSLAGLTARLLRLIGGGPDEARDAREALALGGVYWRAGLEARAGEAFARAVAMADGPLAGGAMPLIKIEGLRALARADRRARRYTEAAARWGQVLEVPGCPPQVAREAAAALAIHHEHRLRDLAAAKAFALRSLEREAPLAWSDAVRHRLARLERKLTPGPQTAASAWALPFPSSSLRPSCGSRTSERRTSS